MNVLDLSARYESGQIAGNPQRHPQVELSLMGKVEDCGFNTSRIVLGSHTGTHMDSPRHLIKDGPSIDQTNLDVCIGDTAVIDFRRFKPLETVELRDVKGLKVRDRMVFAFGWETYYGNPNYHGKWPYFSLEAAEFLVQNGMKLIAVDTVSPDCKESGSRKDDQIHKLFFENQVVVVELIKNVDRIDFTKEYSLAALPLNLQGVDGSPCRVVLFTEQE